MARHGGQSQASKEVRPQRHCPAEVESSLQPYKGAWKWVLPTLAFG